MKRQTPRRRISGFPTNLRQGAINQANLEEYMTVPEYLHAPNCGPAHSAQEWRRIVITVTVIVLGGAGVSPDWIGATAAVLAALGGK